MPRKRATIIGHHLIWTLYGHWLANDLRGSGSVELHEKKFAPLGPVHRGRKLEHSQPTGEELKAFYRQADPLLSYRKIWLDEAKRQAIGEVFGKVVAEKGYTVWGCAILLNHAHMVIRKHRDDALAMWHKFADATRLRLRLFPDICEEHPVWSERPYKVFLTTPEAVRACILYVEQNPKNEGLQPQEYSFVQPYRNWPFHKR